MTGCNLQERWIWGIVILCFLPWAASQINVSIPADMAWLSLAADHFLSGQKMTEAFHDNNPPLCYLVYLPVAFLAKTGMPLWTAGLVYAMALLVTFAGLLGAILRQGSGLRGPAYWAIIFGYLIPLTLFTQVEFGNKDHLIAIVLLPFLVAQLNIDYKTTHTAPIYWAIFILATPFILMKPHYGLLPVCMLGYRFFAGRRFKILLDPDFLCLAVGTILYLAITLVWFNDYVTDILLDVSVGLYASMIMDGVFGISFALAVLSVSLIVLAVFTPSVIVGRNEFIALSSLSLIAIIPFLVQMKGFSLHLIPYLVLAIPALLLALVFYLSHEEERVIPARCLGLVGMMVGFGYCFMLSHPALTHDDVRDAGLTRYVAENANQNGFLMQGFTTNIFIRIAVYTGIPHASRFANFWFVNRLGDKNRDNLKEKYGDMVAEDLERYKPSLVAFYHDALPADDPLVVFADNADFKKAWMSYRKAGIIPVNEQEFYKRKYKTWGSYEEYDVYVRK